MRALNLIAITALTLCGCLSRGGPLLPRAVAHRAGAAEVALADNSLEAVRAAVRDGVELIELDARRTSDGVVVLFHDRTLEGTDAPQAARSVESLASGEVARLRYRAPVRARIAMLAEVLAAVKMSTAIVMIDAKGGSVELIDAILAEARRLVSLDRIMIFCDPLTELVHARERAPRARLVARLHRLEDIDKIIRERPEIVQVDEASLELPQVQRMRCAGVPLMVKTLERGNDHPGTWRALVRGGARFILTDTPRRFSRAMPNAVQEPPCP